MSILAVLGGTPAGRVETPRWPQPGPRATELLSEVLASGRWTVSGPRQRDDGMEDRFARAFARFNEIAYCVATANGTSALLMALEALGVGAGDEVIIPGLTWVANASTVLAVNATPIMVDIDPETLCLAPRSVEAAITERTKAIVVVHLYSSVADLDAILTIAERHEILVVEDCAQAHGARWSGRRVGTLGAIGTFSMQQTKLLTAGEGGAAICHSVDLYDRLFQLRADGRRRAVAPVPGEMELIMDSTVMGSNYCMSEFGAAVLLDQLALLEEQHTTRDTAAALLSQALAEVLGVTLIAALPQVTTRTWYYYTFRIDRQAFGDVDAATLCQALSAETGIAFQPTYPPLDRHPLYQPHTKPRYSAEHAVRLRLDPRQFHLPEAVRAYEETVTFHHSVLLGDASELEIIPDALCKIQTVPEELQRLQREARPLSNPT